MDVRYVGFDRQRGIAPNMRKRMFLVLADARITRLCLLPNGGLSTAPYPPLKKAPRVGAFFNGGQRGSAPVSNNQSVSLANLENPSR